MIICLCMINESNTPGNHFSYRDQGQLNSDNKQWNLSLIELVCFYDYKPVYEILIQYYNVFEKYLPETLFIRRSWAITQWMLSLIELYLYFIII